MTVAAAAFAAGLFAVVAHSQAESDRFLARHGAVSVDADRPGKAEATAKGKTKTATEKKAKTKVASVQKRKKPTTKTKRGRTRIDLDNPGVDAQVTASVSPRPKLKAIARKAIFGQVDNADETAMAGEAGQKLGKAARSTGYTTLVSRYAAAYGVPTSLAHAVITVESNYRVDARGSAGEIGLMQIKPATARMMGYSGGTNGLFNPETNIKFGMKYLGMAHQLSGGNTCGTILRYNAGHGARRMNPVSAAYCSKVKGLL